MFDWTIYTRFVLNRRCKREYLNIMLLVCVWSTWIIVVLKKGFEILITWNDVNGVSLVHISYLITHMAYLWSPRTPNAQIKYFMFDLSIYRLFVLNTTLKRDSLQMMIFICVSSTWSIVHIKDAFWYVNNNKWLKWSKFVSPFSFNNTYGLPVFTKDTKRPNQVFYVWLVDLQTICAKLGLETCLSPNKNIRISLLDMRHSWTKYVFWDMNNMKWRKWCKFLSPFLYNNT
jgi:hypothetical protein